LRPTIAPIGERQCQFSDKKICQKTKILQIPPQVGKIKQKSGFTLMELVTAIALLSVFLVFLLKLNFSAQSAHQAVRSAVKILASSLDNARLRAIGDNNFTCLAIDTASAYKFRRIALYRREKDDSWAAEQVIMLPERTFVIPLDELSRHLDGRDLSPYTYAEEQLRINGEAVDCYSFIFDRRGILCNGDRNSAIIAIGYGTSREGSVQVDSDSPLMGVLVIPTGQRVVLESKAAVEEAI
jgi:prepilin-type N-terminal cleavage/methylation domain-containing protein